MRPVLLSLGPWDLSVLPPLMVGLLAVLLLWQWLEHRRSDPPGLTLQRAVPALVTAVVASLLLFVVVNRFHPVEIKAYGTLLIVAFAAGVLYVARWGDRRVVLPAEVVDLGLFALVGAIVGSRIIFVALDWKTYAAQPAHIFNVWEGGLSFHGGLLGALGAAALFARWRGKSFARLADEVAPAIALGYAFARVGCFLNGCCHGHSSHLPWAMIFPHGEIKDQPVHPTQLYAIVASLAIMFALIGLKRLLRFPGQVFGAYLALYSVARFLLEYSRAGATGKYMAEAGSLTQAQFASIFILLLGLGYVLATWKRRPPASAPD